ncbi:hypothetical protein IWX49DRAFT_597036 [Phyllosticta citricarpa]
MAEELDGIKAEHVKRMDGLDRDLERHAAFLEDLDDTKAEHDKKIEHLEKEVERHERIVAEVRASNEDLQSQIRRVHNKVQEWHDTSFNPRTIGWFFPNLSEKGGARALNLQVDDVLYEDVESFIEAVEAARRTGSSHAWYTSILSETQRDEVMDDDDGLENWFALLRKSWGMSVNEAYRQLSVLTLTPDDMKRRGDASSRFVTKAIHIGRCIGVEDTYAVLCLAYSRLGQELQACVEPPKRGKSVDDFVKRIDAVRLN